MPAEFEELVSRRNSLVEQLETLCFKAYIPIATYAPFIELVKDHLSRPLMVSHIGAIPPIPRRCTSACRHALSCAIHFAPNHAGSCDCRLVED